VAHTYKITFLPAGKTVDAAPPDHPEGGIHHEGKPGSILDVGDRHGVAIDHSCGGFAACSTCHVYVVQGLESCTPAQEDEEDMLDTAPGLKPNSRLACQCVPDGSRDVVVEIPALNRNLVGERK